MQATFKIRIVMHGNYSFQMRGTYSVLMMRKDDPAFKESKWRIARWGIINEGGTTSCTISAP